MDTEKAALVYFILGSNVTAEVPLFERLTKLTLGPLQVGVFYVNESAPEYSDIKTRYKLGSKMPQLRFYRNNLFGEEKN